MKEKILNLPIGHSIDWKFGLITRDVYRKNEKKFELTDMSSGWQNVTVTIEQMLDLIDGKLDILSLKWK